MGIYAIVLVVVIFILFISCKNGKCTKTGVFFIGIVLILVAGFRCHVGTDYGTYSRIYPLYRIMPWEFNSASLKMVGMLSQMIYDDYATWFFLMSFFTVGLCVYSIYTYSEHFALGVLLYLFLGCWHVSFNAVKQYAAIAIILYAQKFLFDGKFTKWCLACLIASTFHFSALLMVPLYFLVRKEIDFKSIAIMFIIGLLIALNYDYFFELVETLKGGKGIITVDSEEGTREINIFRVLVACSPVALLTVFNKYYDNSNIKMRVWANMSILNAVFFIASINSVYMARFCLYTDAFNLFFIPSILKPIKDKVGKWFIIIVCLCLYFAFWWYDLAKTESTSIFMWIFER